MDPLGTASGRNSFSKPAGGNYKDKRQVANVEDPRALQLPLPLISPQWGHLPNAPKHKYPGMTIKETTWKKNTMSLGSLGQYSSTFLSLSDYRTKPTQFFSCSPALVSQLEA